MVCFINRTTRHPLQAVAASALFLSAFWSSGAQANCYFDWGSPMTMTISVPSTVQMPRDNTGTMGFYSSPQSPTPASQQVTCGPGDYQGAVNLRGAQPAPQEGAIFPIGNTGLGWKWLYSGVGALQMASYPLWAASGSWTFDGTTHGFALVQIGPVAPGTTVPAGVMGEFRYGANNLVTLRLAIDKPITVVALSCQTPDVDVPMGTHRRELFTGIGTKVGTRDFTINVNSCPPGMNTVRYRLGLAAGVTAFNAASGIVKLDTTSTATGVAVQVMDRNNVPYNFSTMPWANVTPTYAPASGGNYTIPLRAAYYQTAATVTPGDANSAIMFTMEYK